jgi:hypothetical protein
MLDDTAVALPDDAFSLYLENGFDRIEGWPGQKESVRFMVIFKRLFEKHEEKGGACEIGVHHGKYLIALHNILCPPHSLGIDLFEDQAKNVDSSGRGSAEIVAQNIEAFAYNPRSIALLAKDSLDIGPHDIKHIIDLYGRFAFFSVDGGHTALHAIHDFFTASQLTSPNGIIAVDDLFHPDWPGVTEGLLNALAAKRSPFVPLFITRKKAFLCHLSVVKEYQCFVAGAYAGRYGREARFVEFCGWSIPSLNFGPEYD